MLRFSQIVHLLIHALSTLGPAGASFNIVRQYNLSTGWFGVVGTLQHPIYSDVAVLGVVPCTSQGMKVPVQCNATNALVLVNVTSSVVLGHAFLPLLWVPTGMPP